MELDFIYFNEGEEVDNFEKVDWLALLSIMKTQQSYRCDGTESS